MGNQQQQQQQPLKEDLSLDDYRYIMKQTHLTPHVIQGWYREFRLVCPNGQLTKKQFIKFYQKLENSSTRNVEAIAENVFRAFDHNGSCFDLVSLTHPHSLSVGNNRIDFQELLISYALTSMGEPLDKLHYAFSLFDKDHSESIEPGEMIELLEKLFLITGNSFPMQTPQTLTYDLFRTLDLDRDHCLSKEEFINGCLKSEAIRRILSPF